MAGLNQLLTGSNRIGSNTVTGAKELTEERENLVDFPRIPTNIFPFDYASGGGIPCNVPTQFYGPYQGGKSTLAYMAAKSLSRTCMRCLQPMSLCECSDVAWSLYCPTCKKPVGECNHKSEPIELCVDCQKPRLECSCGSKLLQKTFLCHLEGMPPDSLYFDTLGYDTSGNLLIGLPEYGEQACEMIEAAVRSDDCGLVIVDSLAGLLPKAEMEGAYEDIQVGAQARLIGKLFRRLGPLLVKEYRRGHLIGLIFINQLRANIGCGKWDPAEKTPGGWASKHGYRLSVRVNQLSVDGEKGEKEKADGMKNVGRFSISLLGSESKQQMLILSGKGEYKIVLRDWKGYDSGVCLDASAVVAVAREIGLLEKGLKYYELKGTDMRFRVLSDIDELFSTGEYVDPESGEVLQGGDSLFRFVVTRRAKTDAVASIVRRAAIKVQEVKNPLAG